MTTAGAASLMARVENIPEYPVRLGAAIDDTNNSIPIARQIASRGVARTPVCLLVNTRRLIAT